jgi:hypothetical protein
LWIETSTIKVYCAYGFIMLPGFSTPWEHLNIQPGSVNVESLGTFVGIDIKFLQVSTIDGDTVRGGTDANKVAMATSLSFMLSMYPKGIGAKSIVFGDPLLCKGGHPHNAQNPILLEKTV